MAKQKDTKTTNRKMVRWSDEMRQFVLERPTLGRTELVAQFRAAYPDFSGSDQAVVGQRYRLLHGKNTKMATRRAGLEARIRVALEELAALEAELEALDQESSDGEDVETLLAELAQAKMADVRAKAKEIGVPANGKKADIIQRIREAMAA